MAIESTSVAMATGGMFHCVPGMNFTHDKYGYSLIAVEVTPGKQNRIRDQSLEHPCRRYREIFSFLKISGRFWVKKTLISSFQNYPQTALMTRNLICNKL